MATIILREYNREISTLIDQGLTEEAVSHCKHILLSYPKYVDTYRLLGKAYLESGYSKEALDVFQRILAVLPDDFLTHAGMSFIREDEGNLSGAIWHMERAFETQPSNLAIQEELKILYGKRDGVKSEKLRLTRGALCRMYARGNQYQQVAAEIKSILSETPDRLDLEVLLVEMYEKLNLSNEAISLCKRLLEKYPYCWAANHVLYKSYGDDGNGDKDICYQRLLELDPYERFVNEQYPTLQQVPDDLIAIEKLAETTPEVALIPEDLAILEEEVPNLPEEPETPIVEELATLAEEFSDLEDMPPLLEDTQPSLPSNEPVTGEADLSFEVPDWLDEDNCPSEKVPVDDYGIAKHEETYTTEDLGSAPAGDEVASEVASIETSAEPDISLIEGKIPAFSDLIPDEFVTHMARNDFPLEEQVPLDTEVEQGTPSAHIPPMFDETEIRMDRIVAEATAASEIVPDWLKVLAADENPPVEEFTSPSKQVDDSWRPESADTESIPVEAAVSDASVADSGEPQMATDAPEIPTGTPANVPPVPDWLPWHAATGIEDEGASKTDTPTEPTPSSTTEETIIQSLTNDIERGELPLIEDHVIGEFLTEAIPVLSTASQDEDEVELPEWLKLINFEGNAPSSATTPAIAPDEFEWTPEDVVLPPTPSLPFIIDTSSPGDLVIERDEKNISPDISPSANGDIPAWLIDSGHTDVSTAIDPSQNLPSAENPFTNNVEHSEYSADEQLSDTQPTILPSDTPINNIIESKGEESFTENGTGQIDVETVSGDPSLIAGIIDITPELQEEQTHQEPEAAHSLPIETASSENNQDQSILELIAATNANPGNSELWLLLGDCLRQAGDLPGAIEAYSKAQKLLQ
ncbi:MAG: hypothetical protein C0391_04615 [Anaerolinea sp.]|nr:hypothetical protein [Anaerolinea sp.]